MGVFINPFWATSTLIRPALTLQSVDSDTLDFDAGASGTLYWLADTSPTRSAAQVKAGGVVSGFLPVTAGAASVVLDLGPLGGGTFYFHAILEVDGVHSAVVTEQIVLAATLSGAAVASVTATTASLSVTTDTGEGELFVAVLPSGATPGPADIKSGLGAVFAASLPTPGVGTKTFLASGLTIGTAYQAFFIQTNGPDSVIASTAEFTAKAPQATVNEVLFDGATRLDLAANGVPGSADAITIAMLVRVNTVASDTYFVASGFDSYVRLNATGSTRTRIENMAGAAVYERFLGAGGDFAAGQLAAILLSLDRTGGQVRINDRFASAATYADAGSPLRVPRYVNSQNGSASGDSFSVLGLWIAVGRVRPETDFAAFFGADFMPTPNMLAGNPIAGLTPVFAESGPATKWNARPGLSGAAQDL